MTINPQTSLLLNSSLKYTHAPLSFNDISSITRYNKKAFEILNGKEKLNN